MDQEIKNTIAEINQLRIRWGENIGFIKILKRNDQMIILMERNEHSINYDTIAILAQNTKNIFATGVSDGKRDETVIREINPFYKLDFHNLTTLLNDFDIPRLAIYRYVTAYNMKYEKGIQIFTNRYHYYKKVKELCDKLGITEDDIKNNPNETVKKFNMYLYGDPEHNIYNLEYFTDIHNHPIMKLRQKLSNTVIYTKNVANCLTKIVSIYSCYKFLRYIVNKKYMRGIFVLSALPIVTATVILIQNSYLYGNLNKYLPYPISQKLDKQCENINNSSDTQAHLAKQISETLTNNNQIKKAIVIKYGRDYIETVCDILVSEYNFEE